MNTMKYAYAMIAVLSVWLYAALTIDYNDLLEIPKPVYALILAALIAGTHFLAVRRFGGKPSAEASDKQFIIVFIVTIVSLVVAAGLSYATSVLLGN